MRHPRFARSDPYVLPTEKGSRLLTAQWTIAGAQPGHRFPAPGGSWRTRTDTKARQFEFRLSSPVRNAPVSPRLKFPSSGPISSERRFEIPHLRLCLGPHRRRHGEDPGPLLVLELGALAAGVDCR